MIFFRSRQTEECFRLFCFFVYSIVVGFGAPDRVCDISACMRVCRVCKTSGDGSAMFWCPFSESWSPASSDRPTDRPRDRGTTVRDKFNTTACFSFFLCCFSPRRSIHLCLTGRNGAERNRWCWGGTPLVQAVLDELSELNGEYRKKNGFVFLVCASGLPADAILALLKARLPSDRDAEVSPKTARPGVRDGGRARAGGLFCFPGLSVRLKKTRAAVKDVGCPDDMR